MKAVGAGEGRAVDAARKRAVVETYARHEAALRRTARRYSLCADDAEDALQRGLEILLRKAPSEDPRHLIKWTQTVVKHEAMAVRRERERILPGPADLPRESAEDWIALLPAKSDGPPELAERREAVARGREALRALRPHELRALTLLAEGYSYAEIGEITGFSRTKVNRSLAEGRERFRRMITSNEDGSRCREMRQLLSAFCDGEAKPKEAEQLREHLRACPSCRATLRAYRAAPAAAAALAPFVPLDRSLLERAQDAITRLAERFERAREPLTHFAGGGAGGAGLAKTAVVFLAAASLTTGVGTGLVPLPSAEIEPGFEPRLERHPSIASATDSSVQADRHPAQPHPRPRRRQEEAVKAPGPLPETSPETGRTTEYAPPPAPEASTEAELEPPSAAPAAPAGSASPAGEFGP